MKISLHFLLLQIFLNSLILITAQWCVNFQSVTKTRIQWHNGQRLITKRKFFGGIKYKYEPYVYSSEQTYHDYERVNVCCDGYTQVSETQCEPVCNPSCPANTHCIRPNICECNTGYRGSTASALTIQCELFCRPACQQNAQCIEGNKCICNTGYEDTDGSGVCRPICEKECPENSLCIKPDECACETGYLDNGLSQCKPVCSPKCQNNSECVKPDTCICQQNYHTENEQCVPICEQECPQHGVCVKPNDCECNDGYEMREKLNATTFTCAAKCNETCPAFANCTQPNVCECQQGYKKTDANLCQPICESECPAHSNCSEPNTCTCDKGFTMLEQQCQPVCEKACPPHALCSEPNKCQCESGYQLKLSSIYNLYCEPVCQRNCSSFGKCVEPNKCECLEGYEMDELEICQPVCSRGCKNGFCFQPEVCICKPGYLMGPQKECDPVCSMACQNGSCIEPEICQCHEGFELQGNSINICEPVCKPQCINGICVAPNVCICHENHEPIPSDSGLDHNNCQLIQATTADPLATITPETSLDGYTMSSYTFVSASICNEQCQCWQNFDEFDPSISTKCAHLCVDAFDKPCLDLTLCLCDLGKNQLVCRTPDDEPKSRDPIYYMCNSQRLKATTLKPHDQGIKSDMKSVQPAEKSKFLWWWAVILGVSVVVCTMGILLYLHFRKVEDPMLDYEM